MGHRAKHHDGLTKADRLKQAYEELARLRQIDGKSIANCAVEMGVSTRTIDNYLASEDYQETVSRLRLEWRENARTTIASVAQQAIQTLVALLDDPKSGHVRFEAAKELLELFGVGINPEETETKDDSAEMERLVKILAETKSQTTINIFNQRVEEGGFLPKGLRPDSSGEYLTASQRLRQLSTPQVVDADPSPSLW